MNIYFRKSPILEKKLGNIENIQLLLTYISRLLE